MPNSDIVVDILNAVLNAAKSHGGTFTESMAIEIEMQTRQKYGGDELYIQKKSAFDDKKKAAVDEAKRTGNVVRAAKRNGISRSELYRLINKK